MSDQLVRWGTAIGLGVVYVGLVGYSVFGYNPNRTVDGRQGVNQTLPPRVMYHDNDVDVYSRRNVRSSGQRGGGLRGGK